MSWKYTFMYVSISMKKENLMPHHLNSEKLKLKIVCEQKKFSWGI